MKRRDPMAQTRREWRSERRRRQREAMTLAQVQDAIRKLVRDRIQRDGDEAVIGADLFQQANLPLHLVDPRFVRGVVDAVRSEREGPQHDTRQ